MPLLAYNCHVHVQRTFKQYVVKRDGIAGVDFLGGKNKIEVGGEQLSKNTR